MVRVWLLAEVPAISMSLLMETSIGRRRDHTKRLSTPDILQHKTNPFRSMINYLNIYGIKFAESMAIQKRLSARHCSWKSEVATVLNSLKSNLAARPWSGKLEVATLFYTGKSNLAAASCCSKSVNELESRKPQLRVYCTYIVQWKAKSRGRSMYCS
jgi:hypothetical protein